MIRTTITPENTEIQLSIPEEYVGRKIEIILIASEEEVVNAPAGNNAARFKGILTHEEAEQYQLHLKQARSEWDRDI